MTASSERHLTVGQFQPGDKIFHPNGPRAQREQGLPGLATVTGIQPTNRGNTRFKVTWSDSSGATGHYYERNMCAHLVMRPIHTNSEAS